MKFKLEINLKAPECMPELKLHLDEMIIIFEADDIEQANHKAKLFGSMIDLEGIHVQVPDIISKLYTSAGDNIWIAI